MSLKVWLPLTKDTRNQGLNTGAINWTTAAAFVNNGKLGKALSTGGCIMPASMTSQVLNNKAITIACWLYVNANADDATNRAMIFGNSDMNTLGGRQFSIFRYPNSDDIHLSWQSAASGSTVVGGVWSGVLTPHAWNHVCITYQNPNVKIYVNGTQVGSTSGVVNASSFAYDTNLIWNSTSHYINDFRIYDNCLTAKEVKQLSLGLVLHYPLNRGGWGQENLIVTNSMTPTSGTSGWSSAGTGWANTNVTSSGASNGHAIRCTYSGTTQTSGGIHHPTGVDKTTLANGGIYTLSAKIRASKACIATFQNELMTKGNTINLTTNWQVYSYSCAIDNTKTYQSNVIYVRATDATQNMWIECDWIKLEAGDKATPWCPNSSDALATTMDLNGTIEYDCSGYRNNGTRTGTFSWTSDTPKYSVSTTFSGSQYITEDNEIETTDSTIAAWVKTSLSANAFILDCRNSSGAGKQPIYQYTNGSIQSGGASQYVTTNTGLLVANTWIHLVIVQSGSSLLVYKNGSLFQTLSCTNSPVIKPTVGARYSLSNLLPSGSISDIRIYVTALSAADVRLLYGGQYN